MSQMLQKYVIPGAETIGGGISEFFAPGNPIGTAALTSGIGSFVGDATSGGKTAPPAAGTPPTPGATGPTAPSSTGGLQGAIQSLGPLAGQALGMLAPKPATPQTPPMQKGAQMQPLAPPVAPPARPVAGNATGGQVGPAAAPSVARPGMIGSGGNSLATYANFLRQIGAA